MAYLEGDLGAPCVAEDEALGECGDPGCISTATGNSDSCVFEHHCTGSDEAYAVECVMDSCVCRINGEDVGTCMTGEALCLTFQDPIPDPDTPITAVNDCCGWML